MTTQTDKKVTELFINGVKVTGTTKIKYAANPKRKGSMAHTRYEKYQAATTIAQYQKLNDSKYSMPDLRHDLSKEFLTIVG